MTVWNLVAWFGPGLLALVGWCLLLWLDEEDVRVKDLPWLIFILLMGPFAFVLGIILVVAVLTGEMIVRLKKRIPGHRVLIRGRRPR